MLFECNNYITINMLFVYFITLKKASKKTFIFNFYSTFFQNYFKTIFKFQI